MRSPPDTPDDISRAPSLLPLNIEAAELAAMEKKQLNGISNHNHNHTKEHKSKDAKLKKRTKSARSPLLDALKLPPLSEISNAIPRPVQIK
jgi:hypothetical protein